MNKPVVIGVSGGTGSGKSTVAKAIFKSLPDENILIIEQDAYYKDQSSLTYEERVKTNYDHPLAFDTELLIEHVKTLCEHKCIEKPIYNFSKHNREENTICVQPKEIIIIEGIMILEDERLRNLMDIKIFVDTDADVRILRRILRDVKERGRSLDSVVTQYLTTVKPMHEQFVEPSKRRADVIIPEGGQNTVALEMLIERVRKHLNLVQNQ